MGMLIQTLLLSFLMSSIKGHDRHTSNDSNNTSKPDGNVIVS